MGLFTFGGGWSLIAPIQQRYVDNENIMTAEELLDLVSVGKGIPGMMITNVATLFGYRLAGLAGGIALGSIAIGTDMCTIDEAKDFLEKVPAEQNHMATSCCPAWHLLCREESGKNYKSHRAVAGAQCGGIPLSAYT